VEAKFKIGDIVKAEDHDGYTWGPITRVEGRGSFSEPFKYGLSGTIRRYEDRHLTLVCKAENREDRDV
jgi:hypothetical protein